MQPFGVEDRARSVIALEVALAFPLSSIIGCCWVSRVASRLPSAIDRSHRLLGRDGTRGLGIHRVCGIAVRSNSNSVPWTSSAQQFRRNTWSATRVRTASTALAVLTLRMSSNRGAQALRSLLQAQATRSAVSKALSAFVSSYREDARRRPGQARGRSRGRYIAVAVAA